MKKLLDTKFAPRKILLLMMSGIFFMGCADNTDESEAVYQASTIPIESGTEISVDLDGDGKEDSGWVEYPYNFIHNPNIDLEQPDKFGDVEYWWDIESYIGATLFEKDGKTMVRFISLQYEVDDENTVKCTEVSYRKDGWYIEDIRLIDNYYDKREELLAPWEG